MSVHRSVLRVLVGSVAVLLMLCVGVAGATVPKLASDGNFHAEGGSGIAVDQSSGDIFTTGFASLSETGTLQAGLGQKFNASGEVLSPPSPFTEGLKYGVAVNPTNGHVYVASPFGQIEVDDPNTGAQLSSFGVPGYFAGVEELFGNEAQIVTDAAGNVYVPNAHENEVLEYSETGTLLETFTGAGVHALKGPTGVAVTPSGNVWVADDGHNRIEEFSPTGAFLAEFESEGVRALALDAHGDVLAIVDNSADNCGAVSPPCEHLVEYSESGAQLTDVGAGYFGSHVEQGFRVSMVAVDYATGRTYVTDGLKSTVWVYQPPLAPAIGEESVAEVGTSEAKLGVLIHPGGIQTTYRFEYDTREYREGEAPHGVSVPSPEGSAGEGFSVRTVWASAKGLAPGTTYHYRVVVTNGLGSVVGPDQTFTTESAAQAACPNEQARSGFSSDLPECRAYELVTPPGNTSAQPDTNTASNFDSENDYGGYEGNSAAGDGNRFAYISDEIMPGSQSGGLEFIATRGPNGWTSEDALPLRPYTGNRCPFATAKQTNVLKYSPNLSQAVVVDNENSMSSGYANEFSQRCRGELVEVVSGESYEENLLIRDSEDGSFRLVNLTPRGVIATPATFVAASADLNLIVFSEFAKLTPDALNSTTNLYEWSEGTLRLLKLELPSGAPVAGSVVSISSNGSDVFFTANGNLYARINGERTVQLDEARGGSGPSGGGEFAVVSEDGSQVFFTDDATAGLTKDTLAGSGKNLYRYDVSTGALSDLTPVTEANAALLGISEDGSYVYFTSEGVQSGSETNQFGETAQNGQPNLYVDHEGTTTFVLNAIRYVSAAISANGAFLAFESEDSLTGYDNNGNSEIYLYSAATNRVECASCNPSGEAPTAAGARMPFKWVHLVSDNGQVFFDSTEALLPRDTNGQLDVYEFDYSGGLHLISTGTSSSMSVLLDASLSGNDVFFLTRQSLVPQDSSQEANKIYDAHVDGGFPETALPPACTTADACRSATTPQPSIYGAPSSQTFSGAGNVSQAPATAAIKTKTLTRARKLANALKACKKDKSKSKRVKCEKTARKSYGVAKKQTAKRSSNDRRAIR